MFRPSVSAFFGICKFERPLLRGCAVPVTTNKVLARIARYDRSKNNPLSPPAVLLGIIPELPPEHKADMEIARSDVRFWGEEDVAGSPTMAANDLSGYGNG